jgi:hypothetical protein
MSVRHPILGVDKCPGGAECGHGMTLTTIHLRCCARREAEHPTYGPGPDPAAQAGLDDAGWAGKGFTTPYVEQEPEAQ